MSETDYTSGLTTIDYVVDEFLAMTDRDESDYKRFLQIACRGYTDLNIQVVSDGKKTSKLTVSSINRVSFPDDFQDFVNIAVPVKGRLWELTPKNNMVLTTTETAGVETQDSDIGEISTYDDDGHTLYVARPGKNSKGYYEIEWAKRRIALFNVTASTVWLVYKTSGLVANDSTYIPVMYIPALHGFMAYWDIALNKEVSVNQKRDAERTYLRLKQELRHSKAPTLKQWEAGLLKTFYPNVKR